MCIVDIYLRMCMTPSRLKFSQLLDLGSYLKIAKPDSYVIDTSKLTMLACLTEWQLAIAIEDYKAILLPLTSVI
jgi:hypothetical protein